MSMPMKKKSSANCVWLATGLMMVLIVSAQFAQVECRALRATATSNEASIASGGSGGRCGCNDGDGAEEVGGGMTSFAVSSDFNASTNHPHRPSMRSLAFRLASGPSKKGPGH